MNILFGIFRGMNVEDGFGWLGKRIKTLFCMIYQKMLSGRFVLFCDCCVFEKCTYGSIFRENTFQKNQNDKSKANACVHQFAFVVFVFLPKKPDHSLCLFRLLRKEPSMAETQKKW